MVAEPLPGVADRGAGQHRRGDGVFALGDVQVRPGDIVLGDDDGVVVVPRHRLTQVSDLAAEIAEREDAITAAVLSGAMISDARKRFGYHTLQREGS